MRWLFLLVTVLAIAVPMLAEDFGPIAATESNLLQKSDMTLGTSRFRRRADSSHRPAYGDRQNLTAESDPTCYTMRTYVVKREEPQSDVTRLVGSSSCEWSSKFSVKSAVMEGR